MCEVTEKKQVDKKTFVQTIIYIRRENKNFLKSAASLEGKTMYEHLDEILTKERQKYLKKTVNAPNW